MTDSAQPHLPPSPSPGDPGEGRGGGPPSEPRPRAKRRRRRLLALLLIPILLLIAGELFARFYLGLGDPALSIADPQIEYLFKPDQDCRRFGRRIKYNHYSMRADDFPARKSDPNEVRVLVIGDSVINGGALTDQSELATTRLRDALARELNRPVIVGNVSAGTWGPPNLLAYLKRFGLFDADILVIVVSSHDYADVPTFEPVVGVHPSFPAHKPILALWEGFDRYLLPRLRPPAPAAQADPANPSTAPLKPERVAASLGALREIIAMARAAGATVIVAQHLERDEPLASPLPGHDAIAREVRAAGLDPVQIGPAFEGAKAAGKSPYHDQVHPNALGQQLIAETLLPPIRAAIPSPTTTPTVR